MNKLKLGLVGLLACASMSCAPRVFGGFLYQKIDHPELLARKDEILKKYIGDWYERFDFGLKGRQPKFCVPEEVAVPTDLKDRVEEINDQDPKSFEFIDKLILRIIVPEEKLNFYGYQILRLLPEEKVSERCGMRASGCFRFAGIKHIFVLDNEENRRRYAGGDFSLNLSEQAVAGGKIGDEDYVHFLTKEELSVLMNQKVLDQNLTGWGTTGVLPWILVATKKDKRKMASVYVHEHGHQLDTRLDSQVKIDNTQVAKLVSRGIDELEAFMFEAYFGEVVKEADVLLAVELNKDFHRKIYGEASNLEELLTRVSGLQTNETERKEKGLTPKHQIGQLIGTVLLSEFQSATAAYFFVHNHSHQEIVDKVDEILSKKNLKEISNAYEVYYKQYEYGNVRNYDNPFTGELAKIADLYVDTERCPKRQQKRWFDNNDQRKYRIVNDLFPKMKEGVKSLKVKAEENHEKIDDIVVAENEQYVVKITHNDGKMRMVQLRNKVRDGSALDLRIAYLGKRLKIYYEANLPRNLEKVHGFNLEVDFGEKGYLVTQGKPFNGMKRQTYPQLSRRSRELVAGTGELLSEIIQAVQWQEGLREVDVDEVLKRYQR